MTLEKWIESHAKDLSRNISALVNDQETLDKVMALIKDWVANGCNCANAKIGIMHNGGYACENCGRRRKTAKDFK